jgi:hypothetical protein
VLLGLAMHAPNAHALHAAMGSTLDPHSMSGGAVGGGGVGEGEGGGLGLPPATPSMHAGLTAASVERMVASPVLADRVAAAALQEAALDDGPVARRLDSSSWGWASAGEGTARGGSAGAMESLMARRSRQPSPSHPRWRRAGADVQEAGSWQLVSVGGSLAEALSTAVARVADFDTSMAAGGSEMGLWGGGVTKRHRSRTTVAEVRSQALNAFASVAAPHGNVIAGYSNGDVAKYAILVSVFAPHAEEEWNARGGAYLGGACTSHEFVAHLVHRIVAEHAAPPRPIAAYPGATSHPPGGAQRGMAGARGAGGGKLRPPAPSPEGSVFEDASAAFSHTGGGGWGDTEAGPSAESVRHLAQTSLTAVLGDLWHTHILTLMYHYYTRAHSDGAPPVFGELDDAEAARRGLIRRAVSTFRGLVRSLRDAREMRLARLADGATSAPPDDAAPLDAATLRMAALHAGNMMALTKAKRRAERLMTLRAEQAGVRADLKRTAIALRARRDELELTGREQAAASGDQLRGEVAARMDVWRQHEQGRWLEEAGVNGQAVWEGGGRIRRALAAVGWAAVSGV